MRKLPMDVSAGSGFRSLFLEDSPQDWLHPEQEIQTLLKPGKVPTQPQGLGEGPKLCDSL